MNNDIQNKIDNYGKTIDELTVTKHFEDLKPLLDEMVQFAKKEKEAENNASLYYYLGTGYELYSDYLTGQGKDSMDFDIIELRRWSMFYFRKGIELFDQSNYKDPKAKLRLITNYANVLHRSGRVIEALRQYREVISINNSFSIAKANYGSALLFLSNIVNDRRHYEELNCYAYQAIKQALSIKEDDDFHENARTIFQKIIDIYEASPQIDFYKETIVYQNYEMGKTEEEQLYREWCLNNHLFLNPLNDVLERESAFAHDPLTIATFTEKTNDVDSVSGNPSEPPRWFAMLNQLKEEYVYARYLCFSGIEMFGNVHFADNDVKLTRANYDLIYYSIRIEQLKSSFRILYSMLDQICFFVNDFWKIGLSEREADAFHICKSHNYPKNNISLNSLYWVLCEFYEKYGNSSKVSEDDLRMLRNALEHKFVKIHRKWNEPLKLEKDNFYHLSEDELKEYIMRLLVITRESLMYLVYAIGIEESRKQPTNDKVVSMMIPDYLDIWKI